MKRKDIRPPPLQTNIQYSFPYISHLASTVYLYYSQLCLTRQGKFSTIFLTACIVLLCNYVAGRVNPLTAGATFIRVFIFL